MNETGRLSQVISKLERRTIMAKPVIYVIEPIGIDETNIRDNLPSAEVRFLDSGGWSDEQLVAAMADAEILALTNRPLSYRALTSLPELRMISVAFTGIDHVDAAAVAERSLVLINASGYANTAVAEPWNCCPQRPWISIYVLGLRSPLTASWHARLDGSRCLKCGQYDG